MDAFVQTFCQTPPQAVVLQQCLYRLRQCPRVTRRTKQTRLAVHHHFAAAGHIRGHHRPPRQTRFQQYPRQAFATAERFPGVRLECSWPDGALARLALDERTAVVTVTHEAKLDDPALQAALRSPVFYIGALGSRRTHAKRLARLEEAGFGVADFERIRAPIGLAIGARSPGEIAASIVAEIVKVLRKLDG